MSQTPTTFHMNRKRSCEIKVRYNKHTDANLALGAMRKKFNDPSLYVYGCRFCNKWHIGHPPAGVLSRPMKKINEQSKYQLRRLLVNLLNKRMEEGYG